MDVLTIVVMAAVALGILQWLGVKRRNRRLNDWGRSIALTERQQSAMWDLWQAHKEGRVPKIDPLAQLSPEGREYLKSVCSADYRPREFGSANTLRMANFIGSMEKGYTEQQSAVLAGMIFDRVGRKDLWRT